MIIENIAFVSLLLALQASVAFGGGQIVFYARRPLLNARMDPNKPNSTGFGLHSHRISGGSKFAQVYDPDNLRRSTCSSLGPQADKSNYWHPQVFRKRDDGKYVGIRSQTRIYYNFVNTLPGVSMEPFPYKFQMLAGDPNRRAFTNFSQSDLATFFWCNDNSTTGKETFTLPKQYCNIFATKQWFPSCWNGNAYDMNNPYAHVAFPMWGEGLLGANCPPGYPRRFPSILVETFYFDDYGPSKKTPNETNPYILANGDITGYGFHADFANGWDKVGDTQSTNLRAMINNCQNTLKPEPVATYCPVLQQNGFAIDDITAWLCQYEGLVPAESVGFSTSGNPLYTGPLEFLPGCNLPWSRGPKPPCNRTIATALANMKYVKNPIYYDDTT